MEENKQSVVAVIVTYNRFELLKRCIQSLRDQTRKLNEIIVVNNCSTDGTLEWLNSQNDLTVITQENYGSAGGQYTGIRTTYEKGYDWVWCLDDDGYADKNALYELLSIKYPEFLVRNSLVLDTNDKNNLAFGFYNFTTKEYIKHKNELKGEYYIGVPNFFNGSLIHHKILEIAGLPLKQFFIRGDEVEYAIRMRKLGIKMVTIYSSIYFHRMEKYKLIQNFLFSHNFLFISKEKRFYHTKNLILIHKIHNIFSAVSLVKMFVIDFILILIYQKDYRIILAMMKGIYKGLMNKIQ